MDAGDHPEGYKPHEYARDSDIPFAPDGKSPLICGYVEKVEGLSTPYRGLRCVRKTIMIEVDSVPVERIKRRLTEEAKILYYAQHRHVVRLIHSYFEDGNDEKIKFALVMDRAEGNLHQYLKPGSVPSSQWFGCLIEVVHHIHDLGIRHRDIKPSNILIKDGKVLLADFGISQMGLGKTMPTTNLNRSSSRSREYCAPEVDNGRTRGRSADIFSLGAVFLEMLIAHVYHVYPDGQRELGSMLKPSPQDISSYAKHIVEVRQWMKEYFSLIGWQHSILSICHDMLHPDRSLRPLAEELNSIWSSLASTGKPRACNCAGDVAITERDKLIKACRLGSVDEVETLLDEGADPNTMGAIHFAAVRGSKAIVKALLNEKVDVDAANPVGQTALHCASRNGFDDLVELLLQNHAKVDAEDENGQTALHGAAAQGYSKIVKLLLEAGADVYSEDLDGNTAFRFAYKRHHSDTLRLLEDYAQKAV